MADWQFCFVATGYVALSYKAAEFKLLLGGGTKKSPDSDVLANFRPMSNKRSFHIRTRNYDIREIT